MKNEKNGYFFKIWSFIFTFGAVSGDEVKITEGFNALYKWKKGVFFWPPF